MIEVEPVLVGSVHERETSELPAVAVSELGAAAKVYGSAFASFDAADAPAAFTASTS